MHFLSHRRQSREEKVLQAWQESEGPAREISFADRRWDGSRQTQPAAFYDNHKRLVKLQNVLSKT